MLSQRIRYSDATQYEIVILGGLTGRLDQTIHTLSYLYKLRKTRERVFTVTDDNVAWILDSVSLLSLIPWLCFSHRPRANIEYVSITRTSARPADFSPLASTRRS